MGQEGEGADDEEHPSPMEGPSPSPSRRHSRSRSRSRSASRGDRSLGREGASSMDSELVRLISIEMQCPMCADLLLEPHMVCSNQHNLCHDCLGSLLENRNNRCPECREIITSISRNRFACKAAEALASMKLGTALVKERMEMQSGFKNRQLDLDRRLAAIVWRATARTTPSPTLTAYRSQASPSASDVSSGCSSTRHCWLQQYEALLVAAVRGTAGCSSTRHCWLQQYEAHGQADNWGQRAREVGSRVQDQTSRHVSFKTTLCSFLHSPWVYARGDVHICTRSC